MVQEPLRRLDNAARGDQPRLFPTEQVQGDEGGKKRSGINS